MQLQHGRFKGLRLTHRIREQTQGIQPEGFLHRLLQIQLTLLKGPHGNTGLGRLGDPASRAGHIFDPIQFRLISQNLAEIILLFIGELGELADQRSHSFGRQQILLSALPDLLREQRTGRGGEFIGETSHLLARDLLPLIGRL